MAQSKVGFSEAISSTIDCELVRGEYIARSLGLKCPLKRLPKWGVLSDGTYFSVASLDHSTYWIFPFRSDYIAFLINHYLSDSYIKHDKFLQLHLQTFKGLKINDLKCCPRLAEVQYRPDEIIDAVKNKLPHLNIFENDAKEKLIGRVNKTYENLDSSTEYLAKKLYFNPGDIDVGKKIPEDLADGITTVIEIL